MSVYKTVFKAYFVTELLRNKGIVYGILGLMMWLALFIIPVSLFRPPNVSPEIASAYGFTAILIFMIYSMATWDWAWSLRYHMAQGLLDYVITSGRSIYVLFIGIIPVSLIWVSIALGGAYLVLSLTSAPPALTIVNPLYLVAGLLILMIVLFAHALILGGATLSAGTAGPVLEILGWIIPIATGGLSPLVNMPRPLQVFALMTPYSYPAELIRYSLLNTPTLLNLYLTLSIGAVYSIVYLVIALKVMNRQLKKILKEGVKTIGRY
ncbi:ABC transporter permease [Desulfurococcaceae archaeon MEX13E-LK6-19]|nr:ABC transporter permease [Desulfurococcaceae archaeon MEX13E-LK6-19]